MPLLVAHCRKSKNTLSWKKYDKEFNWLGMCIIVTIHVLTRISSARQLKLGSKTIIVHVSWYLSLLVGILAGGSWRYTAGAMDIIQ